MMRRARYNIGGYEGDQLGLIVQAILNDADAEPHGRERLRELVTALYQHVTAWDAPELEPVIATLGPAAQERETYLREVIATARDAMAGFTKQAGWLPAQQAYSCRMTDAEMKLAQAIGDLDRILADTARPAAQERETTPHPIRHRGDLQRAVKDLRACATLDEAIDLAALLLQRPTREATP